jgi:hypothetical protein
LNAHTGIDRSHPHFVAIPDSGAGGVRAYAEPEVPHPLQVLFLDQAAELAWVEEIRTLLSNGQAAEADTRLTDALDGFTGKLATLCKAVPAESATLEGFDDLLPILEEWEGPAITGITLGLTNLPDLAFEAGRMHEPELLISLYSDDAYPFSRASKGDLIAECIKEAPAWIGAEEDVEFHCTIPALAELNTALIHCKHRHYLRDGRDGVEGRAPGGYVEYVLSSWLLATRFLQSVQQAVADHGLPAGCKLVAGTVEINADFLCVFSAERRRRSRGGTSAAPAPSGFATLTVKPWVSREDPIADITAPEPTLRQRMLSDDIEPTAKPRPGFFARLFGHFFRS